MAVQDSLQYDKFLLIFNRMDMNQNDANRINDFVESAAHDLHAPLRKLSVLIERVYTRHRQELGEDAQEYVGRMERCIAEMRSLIDNLAEWAQADQGSVLESSCHLGEVVRRVTQELQEEINERHASISVGDLPLVAGKPDRYAQLFRNLFENALKFSRAGILPRIDVVTTTILPEDMRHVDGLPASYCRIDVTDNGIGFDRADAEKIFTPFVRLHPKSQYPGSGLGLSIARKIAASHKGSIYAERNEPEGARFILILPKALNHTC
jgi:signal transduction histidine kinase